MFRGFVPIVCAVIVFLLLSQSTVTNGKTKCSSSKPVHCKISSNDSTSCCEWCYYANNGTFSEAETGCGEDLLDLATSVSNSSKGKFKLELEKKKEACDLLLLSGSEEFLELKFKSNYLSTFYCCTNYESCDSGASAHRTLKRILVIVIPITIFIIIVFIGCAVMKCKKRRRR